MKQKDLNCHFIYSGFTFIELAIVLLILGILLGSLLTPLSARIEQSYREKTLMQLDEIKKAIIGFSLSQNNILGVNRLPCPDCLKNTGNCNGMTLNDGVEDIVDGMECATEIGNLPWVTLDINKNDAWGQQFIYRVSKKFADTNDGTGCIPDTMFVSFSLCSNGNISVNDNAGKAIARDVPALVLSKGKNYSEIGSIFEQENSDGDTIFINMDYSNDINNGFDDMLIWISPYILKTNMLNAGILP